MKAFGEGRAVGEGPPLGWAAGKILERAACPTRRTADQRRPPPGLWSIKDDTLGGLTAPLTFVADQPVSPRPCWFTIVVTNRTFTSPDGFRQQCRPLPASRP